jgi:Ca-activated chloride channel family protein
VAGPRREEPPERTPAADERILPRQTVDAVVARSAARLRLCYEDGLRRDPDLAGLITVRFSVDPGGTVLLASDGGATVADPAAIRCVLAAFAAMTFPARPGGEAVWASYVVALPPS